MKHYVVALGMLALAGCTTPQSGSVVGAAQQACVSIAPVVQAASAVPDPKVQSILGYANAVCGPLAAGAVPATVDANTPAWLGTLAGMLKVLAPIAIGLL